MLCCTFTVVKLLRISYNNDELSVYRTDPTTLSSTEKISSVYVDVTPSKHLTPVLQTRRISDDNIIAYASSYSDTDQSMLGTGFLNLDAIFPCATLSGSKDVPRCGEYTLEEDGFNKGKPVIGVADRGKKIDIFGVDVSSYGFEVRECPQFTPELPDGCLHNQYEFAIVCYLPRFDCANPDNF